MVASEYFISVTTRKLPTVAKIWRNTSEVTGYRNRAEKGPQQGTRHGPTEVVKRVMCDSSMRRYCG